MGGVYLGEEINGVEDICGRRPHHYEHHPPQGVLAPSLNTELASHCIIQIIIYA